ncbi:MAG: four helix bundle protein [Candidatus Roizmanbacteria bacterium]
MENDELGILSKDFAVQVLRLIGTLSNNRAYWIITDQLGRSATSIGVNIREAQSSSTKKDFINFFHISLKSAKESKYWISLLEEIETSKSYNKEIESLVV